MGDDTDVRPNIGRAVARNIAETRAGTWGLSELYALKG